jgi:LCP family protein required for cell wall assembly
MSERPPGGGSGPSDDERYNWLYGGRQSADADADATQAIPQPSDPPPAPDSDQTQVISQPDSGVPTHMQPPPQDQPAEPLPPMNLPPPSGRTATETETPPWQQPPPPVKPKKQRRWWLRIILALFLAWILFLILVPIYAWSKIDKVDAEPDGNRPDDQPGTTYLVVGSDSREGLSKEEGKELGTGGEQVAGGQRTDTIMLLHVGDGQPLLLSIPRDSQVVIPGQGDGEQNVNGAFAFGGAELLVQTLENETGIRIDDYVEIGFGGFVNMVDAVGGVEICPDDAIKDRKASLDIEAGCQEADGLTALGYARTRKFATGDIERGQNQREVIGAIGDGATSPWTVINPLRYWNVANSGADSLKIGENVGPISLARFAWNMAHVTGGGGLSCTVPIADLEVNWDEERSEELFQLIIEDRTDDVTKRLCTKSGVENN